MKKIALGVLVSLAFAAVLSCHSIKVINEPAVSLDSVSLANLSFTGADMLAKISIQNDNPFSIPFPEIGWNLSVAGGSFLSGTIKNATRIAAGASTEVELPFTISYEGLYKTISSLLEADEAPYRVDLQARFPLPLLEGKTFSASHSGALPLVKVPAISFSGIKYNSLGAAGLELVLTWLVDNKNAFAVNLEKLDYHLSVNGKAWVSGSAPRLLSVPARRTTPVPLTVTVNAPALVQEIAALAAGGKELSYICGGETTMNPQGFTAPLKLPFTYSGSTKLRR
jgi:LEA14-like dessication related protein